MHELPAAVVAQVVPERVLLLRRPAIGPVEPDLELPEVAPARLRLRRRDAADERVAGPGERAVGGVAREAEIDLVGHLDADHPAVRAEPVHHSAHVLHPRPDVSFLG